MTLARPASDLSAVEVSERIGLRAATLAYGQHPVAVDLSVSIPAGSLTMIIGPNGCGKSTALRAMARLLAPREGTAVLDGADIATIPSRDVARRLGILPQASIAPEGIRVAELVARGRHPHQSLLRRWEPIDDHHVAEAMDATGVTDLAERRVDELSGGQRQRVWIAMAVAQATPTLLLDEPTTYLDLSHQLEVLDLCRTLNVTHDRTIVAVLHDLGHACRYATHMIAMREGSVVASGSPRDVVTEETVREGFGVDALVIDDPVTGTPLVIPRGVASPRGPAIPR